ncbi:MAG: recombinase RecA, partial [Mycobacteriaceae bacterium]
SPPFKIAEFDILYGEGVSREGSIIDLGVENGLVKKSGSWYTYKGDQLGQGKEKSREFLKENPELSSEIEDGIMRILQVGKYAASRGGAAEAAGDEGMDVPGIGGEAGEATADADPTNVPISVVPTFDDEDDD